MFRVVMPQIATKPNGGGARIPCRTEQCEADGIDCDISLGSILARTGRLKALMIPHGKMIWSMHSLVLVIRKDRVGPVF